jgi:hypothetical protein
VIETEPSVDDAVPEDPLAATGLPPNGVIPPDTH